MQATAHASSSSLKPCVEVEKESTWWPALVLALAFGLFLVVMSWLTLGKPVAEKTATLLVMPIGILWLITSGRCAQLAMRGRLFRSKMLLALWSFLYVGGTSPLNIVLAQWLERQEKTYNPATDAPLDIVVVLGGGTSQGDWRAQASSAGDRIVMAAELYHQKLTRRLLTTGEATAGVSRNMVDPTVQTIEIWTKLGIPRDAILTIGGRNTFEEVSNLKKIWPELGVARVGLLTSAGHLPRAMRLARSQQLPAIPVAANVGGPMDSMGWLDFLPHAGNFQSLASKQHEIMAYFVNR